MRVAVPFVCLAGSLGVLASLLSGCCSKILFGMDVMDQLKARGPGDEGCGRSNGKEAGAEG